MISEEQFAELQEQVYALREELGRVSNTQNLWRQNGLSDLDTGHGLQRFGGNKGRLTSGGLWLMAPADSGIIGASERKISWFDHGGFTNLRAHIFAAHNAGLNTSYFQVAVKTDTDGQMKIGFYDFDDDEWDEHMFFNRLAGGFNPVWGIENTAGTFPIQLQAVGSGYELHIIDSSGADVTIPTEAGMSLIVKEADETVSNSDTLQDDNELLFAVAANEVWQFEGALIVSSDDGEDFKLTFTGPTGAVGSFGLEFSDTNPTTSGALLGSAIALTWPAIAGHTKVIRFWGGIHNGATAGNLTLQWAQNAAVVANTIVRAGSYIKYQEES